MKNNKGIAPLIIVLIVAGILALVGGGYYAVKKYKAPVIQPAATQTQTSTQPVQDEAASTMTQKTDTQTVKNYSIIQCGVKLTVKINQTANIKNISTDRGTAIELTVGEPRPNSVLEIQCMAKNKSPQTDAEKFLNDVSNILLTVSGGKSGETEKNDYSVFDGQTLSLIKNLYWANGISGYKDGSETIGFENQDWIYLFSFSNPEQARNQNSFVISIR